MSLVRWLLPASWLTATLLPNPALAQAGDPPRTTSDAARLLLGAVGATWLLLDDDEPGLAPLNVSAGCDAPSVGCGLQLGGKF